MGIAVGVDPDDVIDLAFWHGHLRLSSSVRRRPWSAPAWVQVTARQDCEGSRPSRVGQASDQASDVVGQAGAGSSRALRGKGTSTTASYEWATRAASASLPCQAATKTTGSIVEDGRLRSEPLSLPTPTRSGAQAGTAGEHHSYEP